jgi:hypothetical protein
MAFRSFWPFRSLVAGFVPRNSRVWPTVWSCLTSTMLPLNDVAPWDPRRAGFVDRGDHMTSRNIVEEYRSMGPEDRTAFRRWLTVNTVVGAFLFALVAIAAISSGGESNSDTARKGEVIQHAKAR